MCDVLSFVITVWYAHIHFQSKYSVSGEIGPRFRRRIETRESLVREMSLTEFLEKQKEGTESDSSKHQQAEYQGESHDCYPHERSRDETTE